MNDKLSFPKSKVKILLLEGIHPAATECFAEADYKTATNKSAFSEEELMKAISDVHILGIRSKTLVTKKVLEAAKNLLAVGCYCIGTNQVSLQNASAHGVAVFNAPFSNTRSVAELTMAEVVMLARRATHKSSMLHQGQWDKSADGCVEVRNKTIGIIGYGHIGPQVGLLAEAFGMKVIYFDIIPKLSLANAKQVKSLTELLKQSDFVTLHVPETEQTKNLISGKEISGMKRGAYLLNLSRGSVVDVDAAVEALKSGHLAGAAFDVFPEEPNSNNEIFQSDLRSLPNVILTPHIGGSTSEAQENIGIEVSNTLIKYLDTGSSTGSVNFPQIELPVLEQCHRLLNIHKNVPGVLRDITKIVASMGANIKSQYLNTMGEIGYLIMDVDSQLSRDVKKKIEELDTNIKTRLLF